MEIIVSNIVHYQKTYSLLKSQDARARNQIEIIVSHTDLRNKTGSYLM